MDIKGLNKMLALLALTLMFVQMSSLKLCLMCINFLILIVVIKKNIKIISLSVHVCFFIAPLLI